MSGLAACTWEFYVCRNRSVWHRQERKWGSKNVHQGEKYAKVRGSRTYIKSNDPVHREVRE